MNIYLKPEEIEIYGENKHSRSHHTSMVTANRVAKASADNAAEIIIEYIERIMRHNKNEYDEYWGYLCIDPEDWEELKKLT